MRSDELLVEAFGRLVLLELFGRLALVVEGLLFGREFTVGLVVLAPAVGLVVLPLTVGLPVLPVVGRPLTPALPEVLGDSFDGAR